MVKSSLLFYLLIFLFPGGLFACSCANEGVVNNFQQSEFVAKAKIIKVTPDSANSEYHDAVIEIINLYKGERLSKIKIMSSLNTSCGFLPNENSTWIIFASTWHGMLSFGMCSGSLQIDEHFDSVEYPNAKKNFGNTVKLKEEVLTYLKNHNLLDPNIAMLRAYNTELGSFKGYKNKTRFAVFEVDVDSGFTVIAFKQLKKFQNSELNKLVFKSMKKNLKIHGKKGKPLASPTRLILFCYFYQENGEYPSFLSFFDV